MRIVSIIPARGGSKGIPGKNLHPFCGKPLVSWSITQAKRSKNIASVWISSDDPKVLSTAEEYGANSIDRPVRISGDSASSELAWIHAIDYITDCGEEIDLVVGIQATSPIREPEDFDKAIHKFFDEKMDSLFSSTVIRDHFIWEYNDKKNLVGSNHDYRDRRRRQGIKEKFLENGSFYIFRPESIKRSSNRLNGKIGTYVMEYYKRLQIDTISDLRLCEVVMHAYGLDRAS